MKRADVTSEIAKRISVTILIVLIIIVTIGCNGDGLTGKRITEAHAWRLIAPYVRQSGGRLSVVREVTKDDIWEKFQIQVYVYATHEGFFSKFFGGSVIIRNGKVYGAPVDIDYHFLDIDSDNKEELIFVSIDGIYAYDVNDQGDLVEMELSFDERNDIEKRLE
jgi:hypothetical protein